MSRLCIKLLRKNKMFIVSSQHVKSYLLITVWCLQCGDLVIGDLLELS